MSAVGGGEGGERCGYVEHLTSTHTATGTPAQQRALYSTGEHTSSVLPTVPAFISIATPERSTGTLVSKGAELGLQLGYTTSVL